MGRSRAGSETLGAWQSRKAASGSGMLRLFFDGFEDRFAVLARVHAGILVHDLAVLTDHKSPALCEHALVANVNRLAIGVFALESSSTRFGGHAKFLRHGPVFIGQKREIEIVGLLEQLVILDGIAANANHFDSLRSKLIHV